MLRIDTGVAVVLTDAGRVRASYAARMLARVARDPSRAPGPGDWVSLRQWSDGRTTIEDCLTAPRPSPGTGGSRVVVPLRRRRAPGAGA